MGNNGTDHGGKFRQFASDLERYSPVDRPSICLLPDIFDGKKVLSAPVAKSTNREMRTPKQLLLPLWIGRMNQC